MYQPRLSVVNHQTHVAVIGCGYWGMNYVRVLSELPDSRVTVVCDERAGRLDEVARRFPDVQLTTSIEEALDDDAVEAAVICTQAATHREIAGPGARGRQARAGREAVHRRRRRGRRADRARGEGRPGPPDRPHVPLQRRRPQREDADGRRRARRPVLRVRAPHEPRSVPRGRQRALGPGAARRRDLQLPARRHPDLGQRRGRARPAQRPGGRRLHLARLPRAAHRPHPRELGGSAQGARVRRRRQRPPHRLQRPRRRRARPRLRPGVKADPDDEPTTFGEHHASDPRRATSPAPSSAGTEPLKHLSRALPALRPPRRPPADRRDATGATWCGDAGGRAVAGERTARPSTVGARSTAMEAAAIAGPVR